MSRRGGLEMDATAASPPSFDDDQTIWEDESTGLSFETVRRRSDTQAQELAPSYSPLAPKSSTGSVVLRYFALSGLAVLLTVACPGTTSLWQQRTNKVSSHEPATLSTRANDDDQNFEELQWWILVKILLSLVVTEVLFAAVVRSDPGYVSIEMMDELSCQGPIDANHGDRDPVVPLPKSTVDNTELRSLLPGPVRHMVNEVNREKKVAPPLAATATLDTESPTPTKQQLVSQQRQRRPFCDVCQLAPPLRTHHCRACRRCVATFDHHCPLVGNCVGERNRALFVAFLVAQAVGLMLCSMVVVSSRLGLATVVFGGDSGDRSHFGQNHRFTDNRRFLQALQVFITELYVMPLALAALVMAVSHAVMVACNITTFEIAKGHRLEYLQTYDIADCPFSAGLARNVLLVAQLGYQDLWLPYEWSLAPVDLNGRRSDWWNSFCRNDYWSCC
jgi:DHHC palmitoyltransferase